MRRTTLAVLLLAGACRSSKPTVDAGTSWPPFPQSAEARAALIAQWTRRPEVRPVDFSPERVFAAAEDAGWSSLPAGEHAVNAWLSAKLSAKRGRAWLVFGSFHDAAGQVAAFRRLVGPDGPGLTHVVLEQLRADGRWSGIDAGQRGDSALLSRVLDRGEGWTELSVAHELHDYTAWKYGYAPQVLDVVTTAKAWKLDARGCDVPDDVLALLPNGTDDDALRIRELHCFFSLRDSLAASSRVAMLWGQAHATPDGFRRYLAPEDTALAVYAIGARNSQTAPDELLRERLVLNDVVLVPLGGDEAALLLPDQWLGGSVFRARTTDDSPPRGVRVRSTSAGRFEIDSMRADVDGGAAVLEVAPGSHTYFFRDGELRFVGALEVPFDGGVEIGFDASARSTQVVEMFPSP